MPEICPAEPWVVRESSTSPADLDPESLRQSESRFALANGHVGIRGGLDEGAPSGMPGTYLNSLFEVLDLTYPEEGYGFPTQKQTVVDAPNGTLLRLVVDGEPFDVRQGTVHRHERVLDLRAGTLTREVDRTGPGGARVRIHSERLVSFPHPAMAAIRYQVTAVGAPVEIRLESDLRANEPQPHSDDDPRASTVVAHPFEPIRHENGRLLHRTKNSRITVAAAVEHRSELPVTHRMTGPDLDRTVFETTLAADETVVVDKFLAYAWDRDDAWDAAGQDGAEALDLGFDELRRQQREYLDEFWAGADVELDGDPEVQQGVRFGLFHVLQAGAQAGPHPIPAKGLTGNGYDGHTLWDTETFVLPVLTYTHPEAARLALQWRHETLDLARERARELRLSGATYPWRTISGPECSGYWPAGTAALHLNADIAAAVLRHQAATDDETFLEETGLDILTETARLWAHLIHVDDNGVGHLDGLTGPDEYTALVDDNTFTNLAVRQNLRGAVALADRLRDRGVGADEIDHWAVLAETLFLPYSESRQVHEQHHGFTRYEEWDFDATGEDDHPLFLHHPYLHLYRRQVIKQADLVLAMMLHPDAFTDDEKLRNFVYYEARTVRDSSLSAPAQAVLAAETGHLDLAHDYLAEAALLDLRSGGEAGGDGLHIASCAGAWTALVMGFGGMRDHDGTLSFAPRLPDHLPRLRFRLRWRGALLTVTVTPTSARYEVTGGEVTLRHHGDPVTVTVGSPVDVTVPDLDTRQAPWTPRPPAARPRHPIGVTSPDPDSELAATGTD